MKILHLLNENPNLKFICNFFFLVGGAKILYPNDFYAMRNKDLQQKLYVAENFQLIGQNNRRLGKKDIKRFKKKELN